MAVAEYGSLKPSQFKQRCKIVCFIDTSFIKFENGEAMKKECHMSPLVVVLMLLVAAGVRGSELEDHESTWFGGFRALAALLEDCKTRAVATPRGYLPAMQACLRDKTLLCLDGLLSDDVIPLAQGVELVRRSGNHSREWTRGDPGEESTHDLPSLLMTRLSSLLKTHALRLGPVVDDNTSTARLRRYHYKHMFPLMVVGFMTMSSFLVPMGFQFMAMLGGKALLLSKMALMMATMQGYKKLASFSPYPYPYDVLGAHYGYHDRVAQAASATRQLRRGAAIKSAKMAALRNFLLQQNQATE